MLFRSGQADAEEGRRAEALRRLVLKLQDAFNVLEQARMPVLSAIQGGCIGGGVDMVCATDARYCTEDTFFVVKETQLGIVADLGILRPLGVRIPYLHVHSVSTDTSALLEVAVCRWWARCTTGTCTSLT